MYWTIASWDHAGSWMLIAQNGEDHSEIVSRTGIGDRCTLSGPSRGNSTDRVFPEINKIWKHVREFPSV